MFSLAILVCCVPCIVGEIDRSGGLAITVQIKIKSALKTTHNKDRERKSVIFSPDIETWY